MSTKRFFLALAIALISFGNSAVAAENWGSIFSPDAFAWNFFECAGGGNETFSNLGANSTAYSTRTWTGENSVGWSATDSRTDQTLNGKALTMRTGTLTNTTTITGGVGTLSFNYKRVFTGNSTLKVFVNGTQFGGDITVSSETATAFTTPVNVSGNVTIEIRNSGNRTIIDDLVWTCNDVVVAGPEIQLANASGANVNCGELDINFGSQQLGVAADAVFTIKNTGTSALTGTLVLSNTTDFSIVSPSAASINVAASGSTIVLVRFNGAAAGEKTGTLTINSNDANEAACVVNLEGTTLAPCETPVVTEGDIDFGTPTPFSVIAAVTFAPADSYIVVLSTSATLGAAPVDGTDYNVGNTIGAGTVAYKGSLENITLSGLTENTIYHAFVFPYNNTDCTGGPLYAAASIQKTFSTPVAPCNGANETFANIGTSSSSYSNRTWTGDNGWNWNATDARTDQTINSKAITLRNGSLTNVTPINGGMGNLSFTYKRVFNDNSTLKVFVNGQQYGSDIIVSSETPATFSYDIDINAPISLEIVNSGNRTVIDDLVWNCYAGIDRPELQLLDEEGEEVACGDLTIDFGTIQTETESEKVVTISNKGLQPLTIDELNFSDASFMTVTTLPIVIPANETADISVIFYTTAADTYNGTLTIVSDDANEGSCVVNLTGKTLPLCAEPATATGAANVGTVTYSTAGFNVTGVTASGYVAFYTTAGNTISAPDFAAEYTVGQVVNGATVGYVGTSATFTILDLSPETDYVVAVYPYNNTECVGGPAYSFDALNATVSTPEFTCTGASETFSNIGANASNYATRTWTGDNNIDWIATDARTDQTENGKAITIRTGSVKNVDPILGGIGTLTFKYKRVFSGNSTLKIMVNGSQVGADITVSSDVAVTHTETVNIPADAIVELVNSGNRIVIDDITWTCFEGAARGAVTVKSKSDAVIASEIALYPNPNNGQFQINLNAETADVVVYDALGKVVLSKKVSNNEMIDLGAAQKGIYMVSITTANTTISKKVIVK